MTEEEDDFELEGRKPTLRERYAHQAKPQQEPDGERVPVVTWRRRLCPNCGSDELRTHTVREITAWHVCKFCGCRFKSVEVR